MHEIRFFEFEEKKSKQAIQKELDTYAELNSDCNSPLETIEFKNVTFDTYELAEEYLENYSSGKFYPQTAVKYRELPELKPSKALLNLRARRDELIKKRDTFQKESTDFSKRKSKTVGCPTCGSQLATKYLKTSCCPLCRTELRSKTDLSRLEGYNEKIKELNKEIKKKETEERKKQATKFVNAKVFWLVRTEIHV